MAPAFGEAALALEPGEFTTTPVETEFGWHIILLVDRRADNIPSFLDMQDSLQTAATKEAVDRLVSRLRQQAYLEMFPDDAQAAGAAKGDPTQPRASGDPPPPGPGDCYFIPCAVTQGPSSRRTHATCNFAAR